LNADGNYMAINTDALDSAQQELATASASIQQLLEDLQTYAAAHLAEWNAPAKEAYARDKVAWDNAANDQNTVLSKASQHLGFASETYSAYEAKNTGLWTA
jgi:uncharacterized protein YukE